MAKQSKMPLFDLRNYLRERGYKASYTEYKGYRTIVTEAVHVWGDGYEEAAKLAREMGYKVEKEKSFKRYEITYA